MPEARPPGLIETIRNPILRNAAKQGFETIIKPWWLAFLFLALIFYGIGVIAFGWPG